MFFCLGMLDLRNAFFSCGFHYFLCNEFVQPFFKSSRHYVVFFQAPFLRKPRNCKRGSKLHSFCNLLCAAVKGTPENSGERKHVVYLIVKVASRACVYFAACRLCVLVSYFRHGVGEREYYWIFAHCFRLLLF